MSSRLRFSLTHQFQETPVRRLNGITCWVIEDPESIYDFINTEVRKEWESDAKSEGRDPRENQWLHTLQRRKWCLEIVRLNRIRLNPAIMNYVDKKRAYVFSESLAERKKELRSEIEKFSMVIWPVVVRREDMVLADGYCRYATLRAMNVKKTYAYLGTLDSDDKS